ncbi:MAG TPA: hypothetical protein VHG08_04165, partial [Longimicrobium sp.]|nr:hypothetical protein [Longimicrobium sp.]
MIRIPRIPLLLLALAACGSAQSAEPAGAAAIPRGELRGLQGRIVFLSERDSQPEIYSVRPDGRGLRRLTRSTEQTDLSPRVSPDGDRVAWEREIGLPGGGVAVQLWVMDIDGGNARVVLDDGAENRAPAWAADGSALYYASYLTGNWEIFRLDLASGAT